MSALAKAEADALLGPVLTELVERAPAFDRFVSIIVGRARRALTAPASGTMRAWMEGHNGQLVTTVQLGTGDYGSRWCPTGRTIDATRAGSVRLSGSTRDYAGMRVLHADSHALIVSGDNYLIAYVIEGEG